MSDLLTVLRDEIRAAVRAELRAQQQVDQPDPDEWVDQSASPFGRKLHTRLCRQGALPGVRLHRRWLVRRKDIETYVQEHGVPVPKQIDPTASELDQAMQRAGGRKVR